jgi:hypothetical protein
MLRSEQQRTEAGMIDHTAYDNMGWFSVISLHCRTGSCSCVCTDNSSATLGDTAGHTAIGNCREKDTGRVPNYWCI